MTVRTRGRVPEEIGIYSSNWDIFVMSSKLDTLAVTQRIGITGIALTNAPCYIDKTFIYLFINEK